MRRAEADERRKEKEKIKDKKEKEERKINNERKPRPTNYRRDSNGNIILFGNIKVSRMSGVVFGIIAAIAVFFAVVSTGVGDMEYETISYDACLMIDFNDSMCALEYKFCHEFADGTTECKYAETNPWSDTDKDETKWAPEEQDFLPPPKLPPTEFLLPFAEARGPDEPACYTCDDKGESNKTGEENNLWSRSDITISEQAAKALAELTPEKTNKTVKELRQELDDLELEMNKLEKQVQLWILEEPKLRTERWVAESAMEDAEDVFKDKQKAYRHIMDVRVQNTEDIRQQEIALKEFKAAARTLQTAEKEYEFAVRYYDEETEAHYERENELAQLEDRLDELLDELNEARLASNLSHRDYQFVTISLSDTCITMIENDYPTKCPTYRTLYHTFDTSIPLISGQMEDLGHDLKRGEPKYDNHWKYYEQMKDWKVIIVDPDHEVKNRAVNIVVQPNTFDYVENIKSPNKNESYSSENSERYIWKNMKVTQCRDAIVAPDLESIATVVEHVMSKCTTDLNQKETIQIMPTPYIKEDSPSWNFFQWLNNAMNNCKEKC